MPVSHAGHWYGRLMSIRINPFVTGLTDSLTGDAVPTGGFTRPVGLSPRGAPVEVTYDLEAVDSVLGGAFPAVGGLRRYEALLPVGGLPPAFVGDVGGTPVIPAPALSEELEVDLAMKVEAGNPTGSFKDRGLAVGLALGVASGAARFCLPTQGNAGVAAALFSSRLGLPPAVVYMPRGYEGGVYHRACALYGGEVHFSGPNIAAAGKAMRDELAGPLSEGRYVDVSTFFEPGRLEGKKTMGLEIWEEYGEALPQWILYPTGGGTGLVGIWKAFTELREMGWMGPEVQRPRMVAVQSENCAPVVRSFEAGLDHVEPVVSQGTVADGLDVPGAIMGHAMLRVLRDSGGTAAAVAEADISAAYADLGRTGTPGGYETAALLAALRNLRREGVVARGESVLLIATSGPAVGLSHAVATAGPVPGR